VNTIINCLSENDVLGIVSFSDGARVEYKLNEMTENEKKAASYVVSALRPEGSTNLWDGIKTGLDLSQHKKCKSRNTFLIVLSDG
jgi:Mg-chelatase subunit ChlD